MASNRWRRADHKRPIIVDGAPASSTNSATGTNWDAVQKSNAGDGFGVILVDGLACIDLAHCFDDACVLLPWAVDAIRNVDPLFIEWSLPGDGVHMLHEHAPAAYRREAFGAGMVERFSHSRFIRCTFQSIN